MRNIFLFIMLVISMSIFAQEKREDNNAESSKDSLTPEQRDSIAAFSKIFQETYEKNLRTQQVKNIGGIPFGISREDALSRLRNKYGEPIYNPESTVLTFKNIKYAGKDFSSVHFLFESDGLKSYLNACIFISDAKTKAEANKKVNELKGELEKKYNVFSSVSDNGFPTYGGGISPVWDGQISTLKDEYLTAWHIDVIEYEQNLSDVFSQSLNTVLFAYI